MPKRKREEEVDQYFDNMWLVIACQHDVPNLAKILKSMKYQEVYFDNVRIVAKRPHPKTQKLDQVLVIADLKNASRDNLDNHRSDDIKTGRIFKAMFRDMLASLGEQASLIVGMRLANNLVHEACPNALLYSSTTRKKSKPKIKAIRSKQALDDEANIQPGQKLWLVFSFGVHRHMTRHAYYTIKSNLTNNLDKVAKFIQDNNTDYYAKFSELKLVSVRWSKNKTQHLKSKLFKKTRGKRFKCYNSFFNVLALATVGEVIDPTNTEHRYRMRYIQFQDPQSAMNWTAECIDHSVSSSTGWCFDYNNDEHTTPTTKTINGIFDDNFADQGCIAGLTIRVVD